jgi:UDP-N-acetyl-D-mannosaminuronate dehydrogenase
MNEYQKKRFDTRETAAVFVAKHLIAERARLEVYDPQVPASQRYNAAEGVDNVEKLVTMELDVYLRGVQRRSCNCHHH